MTCAIWSFPSQFIASNDNMRWSMNSHLRNLQKWKIVFNADDSENLVKWEPSEEPLASTDDEVNSLLDKLMPSHDSVSWPLLFLWFSVFEFNNFEKYTNLSSATSWDTKWWDVLLSLSINAIVLLFFSLMMLLMFIFNLFRIIMLWLIIPLTPIIVLLHVFKLTDKLWGWSAWMDLSKFLGIRSIMMLVFKPVLMVWALSLILVILVLIKNVIAPDKQWTVHLWDHWNFVIETVADGGEDNTYTSTMKSEWIMEFSLWWVKDGIASLIVYFFWLFLIYFLVKMVVKIETGIWFIDNTVSWLFETVESMAKNLPVIPIAWWVWWNA